MGQALDRVRERVKASESALVDVASRLLSFDSVRPEQPVDGDSLGPGLRACLECAAQECRKRGMTVRVHEGQVAVAELGRGEENVGVAVHLDVVPAAGEWTHPPFGGDVADGCVWGRGAQDNKGPLASVLIALDAIAAEDLPFRRRVTLILGTDEETGLWRDLAAFHRNEPMPTMTIVPDGTFPIVQAEKGFANITVRAEAGAAHRGACEGAPTLLSLAAGERINIVPAEAEAVVSGLGAHYLGLRANAFHDSRPGSRLTVTAHGGRVRVGAEGVPAHASTPERGRSALLDLVDFLAPEPLAANGPAAALWFLVRLIGRDLNGEKLGVFAHDDFMGYCTVCAAKVLADIDGRSTLHLNLRPVREQTLSGVLTAVRERAEDLGRGLGARFDVTLDSTSREPMYVDPESELVRELSAAYGDVMGEPGGCVSIGGTTFAKAFANATAFGPVMPGAEELAHQADERVAVSELVRNSMIYAAAIVRLACAVN